MSALMVIYMDITDPSWMKPYFAAVPPIYAEYGGKSFAAGREVSKIEGDMPAPQRMAVLVFPSKQAIEDFMADERYQPWRKAREAGSKTEIFIFENLVRDGELQ